MGIFSVIAKVYRGYPQADGTPAEIELLVDTGATFSVVPRNVLARLGVQPMEQR